MSATIENRVPSIAARLAREEAERRAPPASVPTLFAALVDEIKLAKPGEVVTLGVRERAVPLREDIEIRISAGQVVDLDFSGVEATQSFMDELVGLIVLERGPDILSRVRFRRCSPDMKGIIHFVVNDRAFQHRQGPRFKEPH